MCAPLPAQASAPGATHKILLPTSLAAPSASFADKNTLLTAKSVAENYDHLHPRTRAHPSANTKASTSRPPHYHKTPTSKDRFPMEITSELVMRRRHPFSHHSRLPTP
ncbi:hypothetical protein HPB48_019790 [Haemaphysalis longicornis]|uniref:Uncharacterized protein n=1 Tax=Haemaphysalis longicornis TaxID=44386 RepID=A0A9J6GA84_HAELO|nr:hypothetical protein HPB48_019790 [Haemaphysalis longicornis]